MNSLPGAIARCASNGSEAQRSGCGHNYSVFKNLRSESGAR